MSTNGYCCGSIPQKKVSKKNVTDIKNPFVNNGVTVIYLGSGNLKISARGSGNTYYVSDHLRNIKVEQNDLREVLLHPEIIQKP